MFPECEDEFLLEVSTSKSLPMINDISSGIRQFRKKKKTISELRLDQKIDGRKIQREKLEF